MATDISVAGNDDLQTFVNQRGHSSALAFVRIGGSALSDMLFGHAKAKETERMGPIEAAVFLETHFPVDAIPVVGSKMEDAGNRPYDRYTVEVQTADGKRKVPGSFFTDVVKNTAAAIILAHRIKWCGDIKWVVEDTGETCPQDILDMGTGERGQEAERCRLAVKDMRTSLTKGAMLLQHCEEIKTLNPDKIKIKLPVRNQRIIKDGQPVVIDGEEQTEAKVYGSLIRLQDPSSEHEDISFTVTQFNQLRPAKLTGPSAGYTIKALENTAERAPKGAAGGKGAAGTVVQYPVPKTLEQLLSCFNAIASGLDVGTEEGKKLEAMLIARSNTEKAGDEYVLSGCAAAMALDNYYTLFGDKYTLLNADKAKVAGEAAKAEMATRRAAI